MMSMLLEILGRAITVDTADLIWHWLSTVRLFEANSKPQQVQWLDEVIKLMGKRKTDAAAEQLRLYLFENPSCIHGRMAAAAICLSKCHLQEAVDSPVIRWLFMRSGIVMSGLVKNPAR